MIGMLGPRWAVGRLRPWVALRRWVSTAVLLLGLFGLRADVLPGAEPKEWPPNPGRHVVVRRLPEEPSALRKVAIAEDAPSGTNAWANGARLGIRLPRALTRPALEYYEGLVRGYRKRSWKAFVEPSSRSEYSATVAHHDAFRRDDRSFKDVDVVELGLHFRADFTVESTQGLHFTKTRTVVLDREGRVLAVFGDGPTEARVLAI